MPEPLPFSPSLGEVGSWTKLPGGREGQVWARTPAKATVWIADGEEFAELDLDQLVPLTADEQGGLF